MTHTYKINGMSCQGCRTKVEKSLNGIDGISAKVTLEPAEAIITMDKHIQTEKLQGALLAVGNYGIEMSVHTKHTDDKQSTTGHHHDSTHQNHIKNPIKVNKEETGGVYYCPMHCEEDKTYDKPGHCPVCGMDLIKQPTLKHATQFTCPMHPEIISDKPGSCPICGMDLVPMGVNLEAEDKTYDTLLRKFKIATIFTVPIFLIAMSEMIPGNPIFKLMELKYWNWVQFAFSIPVVFYATWMFFERAWQSIITWKLNMFTLIGIGAGVAWLFSLVALLFPSIFPDQFKTHHGTVYVYFEAATVILTLVLLGQLLEARAHGKTNSAIKELLKLAPNTATKVVGNKEISVSIDDI